MANKYCNLVPGNDIRDEYTKIPAGFAGVETDINEIDARVDNIIAGGSEDKDPEVVDARNSAGSGIFATVKARLDNEETVRDAAISNLAGAGRTTETVKGAHDLISNLSTSKLDKTASPNRNLLHNWYFRKPVNQGGLSSYSGAVYFIDRWFGNANAIFSINSGYIRLEYGTGSTELMQLIDTETLQPGTYTFSIKYKSTTQVRPFFILNGSLVSYVDLPIANNWTIGTYTFTIASPSSTNTRISIQLNASGYVDIESAKLELGSISTLANDPPADYGEQLALCQRYRLLLEAYIYNRAVIYQPNYIDFFVPTPVTLRISPTINGSSFAVATVAGGAVSGFTFSVIAKYSNGILIRATKTAHGLTDAALYTTIASQMSADL